MHSTTKLLPAAKNSMSTISPRKVSTCVYDLTFVGISQEMYYTSIDEWQSKIDIMNWVDCALILCYHIMFSPVVMILHFWVSSCGRYVLYPTNRVRTLYGNLQKDFNKIGFFATFAIPSTLFFEEFDVHKYFVKGNCGEYSIYKLGLLWFQLDSE